MTSSVPITALVLGVGGNVSQGILKALRISSLPVRVIAACITPLSVGLFRADHSYISPPADDPAFWDWLVDCCREESVNVVLSGVEPVLDTLAFRAEELLSQTGATAVVSSPETLAVGRDKLLTSRWLEANGLPFPRTAEAADADALRALRADIGLPLLAKPRRGKGAEGVVIVADEAELAAVARHPDLVVQELLGDPSVEFTAGCLCDQTGELRSTIVMRRELRAGTTFQAQAGEFPEVREVAEQVARCLAPTGPLNVQLRLHEGRPVPFELNVRFSGTTPARARLGYNEVEAVLGHLLHGEDIPAATVISGTMVRYWNEAYIADGARESLARCGRLDHPDERAAQFEDWGARS